MAFFYTITSSLKYCTSLWDLKYDSERRWTWGIAITANSGDVVDVYEVGPFTSIDRRLGLRLGSGGRVCNIDIWEADYGSVALGPSNSSKS